MMIKKIVIYFLMIQLILLNLAISSTIECRTESREQSFQRLCQNVDDIICKDVPDNIRRSCQQSEHDIVHANMTSKEVYQFTKACLASAGVSFVEFFTNYLPELCKAIWSLTRGAVETVIEGELIDSVKGSLESARSVSSAVYEMIRENPAGFLKSFWIKVVDTLGPAIAQFDCLNPEAKVEKMCGTLTEWIMPPVIFAKILIKGPKAARELMDVKLAKKKDLDRARILDDYKKNYDVELKLKPSSNEDFMEKIKVDGKLNPKPKTLYFDVENSVLKSLNDKILADKNAVDAVGNSFFQKFNHHLKKSPELMDRLDGEYKDYKSYRLRLRLKPGDDPVKFEELLNDIYRKSNDDFALDFSKKEMSQLIPPRTDELGDVKSWFLAGSGRDSIEANMAARSARSLDDRGSSVAHFKNHTTRLNQELEEIEKLRTDLIKSKTIGESKVFESLSNGVKIPSKGMINLLRKNRPSDFENYEDYVSSLRKKAQDQLGVSLDEKAITSLTNYFSKVDSLSPPLFSKERVVIQLDKAENGIVSVDFAGIGVDNIYQQMKGLAEVDLKKNAADVNLEKAFTKLQTGVDQVSEEMNQAKNIFAREMRKVEGERKTPTLFSGDDGIHMPSTELKASDKIDLVSQLATTADPSKYRITFVGTKFPNSRSLPAAERSKRIVRAELLEKDLRSKMTGVGKITEEEGKRLITAIDYSPHEKGGVFRLIVSGKKLSPKEKELIKNSFINSINKNDGEIVGEILFGP